MTSPGATYPHNDAPPPAIDDIMRLVAQVSAAALEPHGGGVRVSRADAEIGGALVDAAHPAPLPALLGDPVMAGGIGRRQRLP